MKLAEKITFRGHWWLPTSPEVRVSGITHIDKYGATSLEILGELVQRREGKGVAVLFGQQEDGTPVTAFNCRYTRSTRRSAGLPSAELVSRLLVIGAHLPTIDDLHFDSVGVDYEHIDQWLGKSGINVKHDYKEHRAEISYRCPSPIRFEIMNDLALHIEFHWDIDGAFEQAPNQATIAQSARLTLISSQRRSFSEFRELVLRLSYFFCLAMDRPVAPSNICAQIDAEDSSSVSDGRTCAISLFYPDYAPATSAPFYSHWSDLFKFNQIEDHFQFLLSNWFREYDTLEDSLNIYFASTTIDHPLVTTSLLLRVQALETLHRSTKPGTYVQDDEFDQLRECLLLSCPQEHKKWLERKLEFANEISLRERLRDLAKPLKKWFPQGSKIKRLIDFTTSARNYYTHYSPRLKAKLVRDEKYWLLSEQLKALFVLQLLDILKFPSGLSQEIVNENSRITFALWSDLE